MPAAQKQRLEAAELSQERFWAEHVVPRKPGLFAALSPDLAHLPALWTDEHLIAAAGEARVEMEQRGSAAEGFGKGPDMRVLLTFGEVLRRGAAGDASLYLTTQAVPTAPDGHPAPYASPIAELARDVPLVPSVMGLLVPQSINLWLGAARDGSSTGLHTDYHDNLYVLLRGRKRFRLYPPQAAKHMYTVGAVAKIHSNGRIVFKGQGDVLPDGSEAGEAAQWLARRAAETELAAAEEAAARDEPGAAKRLRAAERRLDRVLEAALGEDDWGAIDDFDALEAPQPSPAAAAGDPESFSRVDLHLPDAQLKRQFPLFPGKAAALECEVQAGQMLYLPAGWFHEVTSYSTADSPTHMALNYWYHPPDNLHRGAAAAMEQPYTQPFWPAVWEGRRREYEARHRPAQEAQQQQQPAAQAGVAQQAGKPLLQAGRPGRGAADEQAAAGQQSEQAARQHPALKERRSARRGQLVPITYGLFGVGRRQHLAAFVDVKGRKRKATGR
ncbi:hypothetical protein ABPG75_004506 [Micractinium tetrahymenae]